MLRNLILVIIICGLTSCNKNEKFDSETIKNLSVYSKAKDLINKNRNGINQTLKDPENSVSFWNLYYFEHTILPDNPNLISIKSLWSDEYISRHNSDGLIHLGKNGLVGFVTFHEEGRFTSITHLLVFTENEYIYPWPEEIIEKKKIESDWTYLVLKKYTAD